MQTQKKRGTAPVVVLSIALLVVAMGGSSFAGAALAKNSVGSQQLKANAVKSSKVKDGSLLSSDFATGQLPAGATGPAGPPGPGGAAGTARAFGDVRYNECLGSPSVCPVHNAKGGASVRHVGAGRFCVTVPGVSAQTDVLVAGVDYQGTSHPQSDTAALWSTPSTDCPLTDFEVVTTRMTTVTVRNAAGNGTTSVTGDDDDFGFNISFEFVVP